MKLTERRRLITAPGRRWARGHLEQRGKSGVWWARFSEEVVDVETGELRHRQRRELIGRFRSRAAAERAWREELAKRRPSVAPGRLIPLTEYAARYDASHIALLRRTSQRTYRIAIKIHLLPRLGHLPLNSIGAEQLQGVVGQMHADGRARQTIRAVIVRAIQLLRAARREGFSTRDVTLRGITLPREQDARRERRHFEPEEVRMIMEASSARQAALWGLAGYGGLRCGECLAMRWSDIDFEAGLIHITRNAVAGTVGGLKTARSHRVIPALPELVTLLQAYKAQCGGTSETLLFGTRSGRPLDGGDIRRRWLQPLLRRLHLPSAGMHAWRHSTPKLLDSLGIPSASIQKWLGHTSIQQTEAYLHVEARDLRRQLDKALATQHAKEPI